MAKRRSRNKKTFKMTKNYKSRNVTGEDITMDIKRTTGQDSDDDNMSRLCIRNEMITTICKRKYIRKKTGKVVNALKKITRTQRKQRKANTFSSKRNLSAESELLKQMQLRTRDIDGNTCIEVECGNNQAVLCLPKLVAGSKGACINHLDSWLTPNEFQLISGRETAKDWKKSIRHDGKCLKLLIANGLINVDSSPIKKVVADVNLDNDAADSQNNTVDMVNVAPRHSGKLQIPKRRRTKKRKRKSKITQKSIDTSETTLNNDLSKDKVQEEVSEALVATTDDDLHDTNPSQQPISEVEGNITTFGGDDISEEKQSHDNFMTLLKLKKSTDGNVSNVLIDGTNVSCNGDIAATEIESLPKKEATHLVYQISPNIIDTYHVAVTPPPTPPSTDLSITFKPQVSEGDPDVNRPTASSEIASKECESCEIITPRECLQTNTISLREHDNEISIEMTALQNHHNEPKLFAIENKRASVPIKDTLHVNENDLSIKKETESLNGNCFTSEIQEKHIIKDTQSRLLIPSHQHVRTSTYKSQKTLSDMRKIQLVERHQWSEQLNTNVPLKEDKLKRDLSRTSQMKLPESMNHRSTYQLSHPRHPEECYPELYRSSKYVSYTTPPKEKLPPSMFASNMFLAMTQRLYGHTTNPSPEPKMDISYKETQPQLFLKRKHDISEPVIDRPLDLSLKKVKHGIETKPYLTIGEQDEYHHLSKSQAYQNQLSCRTQFRDMYPLNTNNPYVKPGSGCGFWVDPIYTSRSCACSCLQKHDVRMWSLDDVCNLLLRIDGCESYTKIFHSQGIDGRLLPFLTTQYLTRTLGMKTEPALRFKFTIDNMLKENMSFYHCPYCPTI